MSWTCFPRNISPGCPWDMWMRVSHVLQVCPYTPYCHIRGCVLPAVPHPSQPSARLGPTRSGKLCSPEGAALPFWEGSEVPPAPALRQPSLLPHYLYAFLLVKWFGRRISWRLISLKLLILIIDAGELLRHPKTLPRASAFRKQRANEAGACSRCCL